MPWDRWPLTQTLSMWAVQSAETITSKKTLNLKGQTQLTKRFCKLKKKADLTSAVFKMVNEWGERETVMSFETMGRTDRPDLKITVWKLTQCFTWSFFFFPLEKKKKISVF